jgi:hypothetical protein
LISTCCLYIFIFRTIEIVEQLFYATIFLLLFQTNLSLCFYPQLLSSTQLFTHLLTNSILPLYSLNITSGFSLSPTCSSASMESYTVSTSPTSNSLLYSKKSFNMEETKKVSQCFRHSEKENLQQFSSSTILWSRMT